MNNRFDISETPLLGLRILERKPIGDSRGYLERLFCRDELVELLPRKQIIQINQTLTSVRGTVRGLHFQHRPYSETKIVSCLEGEVFDVAIDLRHTSPTYLMWHGEVLSPGNHKTFLIPDGFAHGFQTLSDTCRMMYFHTAPYNQQAEGGLSPTDPKLAINWPLPLVNVSERDMSHPLIDDNFQGVDI